MSANAFRQRGLILLEQGRHPEADREFRQALALEPEDAQLHALLALALVGQARWQDALAESERVIGLDPGSATGHRLRGQALLGLERPAPARLSLEQALAYDPEDPSIHALLALSFIQQKRWAQARDAAQAGLRLDPEDQDCLNQLALAQTQLGEHADADAGLGAALSRDPENALTHANLGWSLLRQHRHAEAMRAYREALRLDPTLEHARAGLIEAIKGRNPIYALFLRYFLMLGRLRPGMMIAILVGTVLLRQGIVSLAEQVPAIATPLMLLFWGLVGFILTTWIAVPLFNATLLAHPLGRHALSRAERVQSFGLWLLLLAAAVAGGIWATGAPTAGLAAILLLVLSVPVTKALTPDLTRGSRMTLAAIAVVFIGLGGCVFVDGQRMYACEERVDAVVAAAGYDSIDAYNQDKGWTKLDPTVAEEMRGINASRPALTAAFSDSTTRFLYAFVAFTWLSGLLVRLVPSR